MILYRVVQFNSIEFNRIENKYANYRFEILFFADCSSSRVFNIEVKNVFGIVIIEGKNRLKQYKSLKYI